MWLSLITFAGFFIAANMAARFIMEAVRDTLVSNIDEVDACVGGQGPFDHLSTLKDARVDMNPYRQSQMPAPVKPSIRERVEKDNYASAQALATLDVADAIRELADVIREKNNA